MELAAIRLAVLEEPESEENIIFDQKPQPSKTQWFLDLENSPEGTQHDHGARRNCKAPGNARGDVAFSSLLVRVTLPGGKCVWIRQDMIVGCKVNQLFIRLVTNLPIHLFF